METVFDVPLEVRPALPVIVCRRLALEPSRTACLHLHLDSADSSSTKCRRRHAVRPPQTADPTLSTVLTPPPSRAQTFLRVVYGDDGFFFRRFHAETGECEDAVVPPGSPSPALASCDFPSA